MKLALTVNIADVLTDLDTLERGVEAQTLQIVTRSASKLESRFKSATPVGKTKKRAGQRLSTGWQRRDRHDPTRPHVALANVRPHAHLAAEGFEHVGGKHVDKFVPWIGQAVDVREEMGRELEHVVDRGLPVALRALEVSR